MVSHQCKLRSLKGLLRSLGPSPRAAQLLCFVHMIMEPDLIGVGNKRRGTFPKVFNISEFIPFFFFPYSLAVQEEISVN